MDYGYSCMGTQSPGAGVKMADPSREVYVLVGDGSYLMMAQEIVTSLQEKIKLNIVLFDNHGFSSIGGLSRAVGSGGFGTEYRYREEGLTGPVIPIDFAANAASLGAYALSARTYEQLGAALAEAKKQTRTSVVVVETDYNDRVPGYNSWWDVPVAEVSESQAVREARAAYIEAIKKERYFWPVLARENGTGYGGTGAARERLRPGVVVGGESAWISCASVAQQTSRYLTRPSPLDGCPCSRFCVHGLKTMGDLDFLYAAPDMTACAAFSKESRKRPANATKLHRKSGEALPFSFPVSRCRPVVKELEKARLQPMYAEVREHGAPVQGERLGGKPGKQWTK